jgi:ADP-heptose:LPS heptosyltransferase
VAATAARLASPRTIAALASPLYRRRGRRPHADAPVRDARSILVLRPDAIGDLILTSPFLRELRRSNPGAWITLAVDPRFRDLVELCPHVNEVLGLDLSFCGRTVALGMVQRSLSMSKRHLWPRRFDVALAPRWDVDLYHSAYAALFSGAAIRVGYSENVTELKREVNGGFDSLFTRTLDDRACKHEVEHNLDLLRAAGGTVENDRVELWLSEQDREIAGRALSSRGFASGDLLIALALGARDAKRVWPLSHFIELARTLQREQGARFVAVGGPEDRDRGSRLVRDLGADATSLAGELTLRQTAALFESTRLAITNDSGPMHLAAAAGAAVLEISCHPSTGDPCHRNSPARFHPWAKEYAVLRPSQPSEPCTSGCESAEAHCILGVSVEMAHEAAKGLLANCGREKLTGTGA